MTAITKFPNRFLHQAAIQKSPTGLGRGPCAENRQEALDTEGSFRDGFRTRGDMAMEAKRQPPTSQGGMTLGHGGMAGMESPEGGGIRIAK